MNYILQKDMPTAFSPLGGPECPHKKKKVLKDEKRLLMLWFAKDTAHFCVHPCNICSEASAHLYGEEQSF